MSTTQIRRRQIEDGAIDNSKVAAGAGIDTSKLAEGADFVQRDGSVAMTGNLDMGGQRVTNVSTPLAPGDAAPMAYVDSKVSALSSILDSKGSVIAATSANVNLSAPASAVFDGVTVPIGGRVLMLGQTAAAERAIYVFNGVGVAMTLSVDFDSWDKIPGALVAVEEGSTYGDTMWFCTANSGGSLGTTPITWKNPGLVPTNFVYKVAPSGAIDGTNTSFTLPDTPLAGSEHVYLNGLLQSAGAANDYTISGPNITMSTAPLTSEVILVSYTKA